ncbi:vicilin-like seed storage protein, partial [Rosa sericea]
APRFNNQAKAKAIALRMKALQMKRGKKTLSKPAVEETDAPPKSAFTKHDQ